MKTPIDYIRNAKTYQGWVKTVKIALMKVKELDNYTEVLEAIYEKHDYFVYQRGVRYGLGSCAYTDTLDQIRYMTTDFCESYIPQKFNRRVDMGDYFSHY